MPSYKNLSLLRRILDNKRGATVAIAMGLSLLIIGFSFGIAATLRSTNKNITAFKDSSQAQFKAESAKEILLLAARDKDAGYNIENCVWRSEEDGGGTPGAPSFSTGQTSCEEVLRGLDSTEGTLGMYLNLIGRVSELVETGDTWYVVPEPGTGLAAGDRGCDAGWAAANGVLDDACNWGKLEFGNTYTSRVAIPLYFAIDNAGEACGDGTDGANGGVADGICNPVESELTEIKIRLRTPCKNQEVNCGNNTTDRYKIGGDKNYDDTSYKDDKTVVNWEIGARCTGSYCALVPWQSVWTTDIGFGDIILRNENENSEVFESLIREMFAHDYIVLRSQEGESSSTSFTDRHKSGTLQATGISNTQKTIMEFLHDPTLLPDRPVLQLSLVAKDLFDDSETPGRRIPYLEYQILADAPIANSSTLYSVQVNYRDQSYKIEESREQDKKVLDFAIQN